MALPASLPRILSLVPPPLPPPQWGGGCSRQCRAWGGETGAPALPGRVKAGLLKGREERRGCWATGGWLSPCKRDPHPSWAPLPPTPLSVSLASHLGLQNLLHPLMLWVEPLPLPCLPWGGFCTRGGGLGNEESAGLLGGPLQHKRGRPTGWIGGRCCFPREGEIGTCPLKAEWGTCRTTATGQVEGGWGRVL